MRAVSVVLAIAVAACMSPAGRLFKTTQLDISPANPSGDYPVPIVLGDETDLVTGIGPTTVDPSYSDELAVEEDPTDPDAIIAKWLGGACEHDAALSFRPSGSGYALHLEVHRGFGSCPADGVLRSVRIKTVKVVPLDSITVSGRS
jgi:hypothetical protein